MPDPGISRGLLKSLRSWRALNTILLWVWALVVAGTVTADEVYFNDYSQHAPYQFWHDFVPGYFSLTVVFTGVLLGLSKLAPLKGWLGIFTAALVVSIAMASMALISEGWRVAMLLERNLIIIFAAYLMVPFLIAALIDWRSRAD